MYIYITLHLHYVFLCSLFSPFQMKTFLFPFRDFFPPLFLFFFRKQNVTSGNRPFQLFSTLTWIGQGAESIETTEKSALILEKLSSLNVIYWKPTKILLFKVAKIYRHLYVGEHKLQPPPPPPRQHKNVANLRSYIFAPSRRISLKFGNFDNLV